MILYYIIYYIYTLYYIYYFYHICNIYIYNIIYIKMHSTCFLFRFAASFSKQLKPNQRETWILPIQPRKTPFPNRAKPQVRKVKAHSYIRDNRAKPPGSLHVQNAVVNSSETKKHLHTVEKAEKTRFLCPLHAPFGPFTRKQEFSNSRVVVGGSLSWTLQEQIQRVAS